MARGSSRGELIKELSRETDLREEVVEVVLDRLVDIIIEKVANGEEFSLMNIFSIASYESELQVPANPKTGSRGGRVTKRMLRARLSKTLRDLYYLQQERFADSPLFVNRDNWRDAIKWSREGKAKQAPAKKVEQPVVPKENHEVFNPLLDDED